MAWCTGGSSGNANMYTSDVVGNAAGGQVIRGDFNGDGIEDTLVLGGGGNAGGGGAFRGGAVAGGGGAYRGGAVSSQAYRSGAITTQSAFGGGGGAVTSSRGFASRGGASGQAVRSSQGFSSGAGAALRSSQQGSRGFAAASGGGATRSSRGFAASGGRGFAASGGGGFAASGGASGGGGGGAQRSIAVGQLSGGQEIRGDFNGDGVEDRLILGTRGQAGGQVRGQAQLGASVRGGGGAQRRCNAGPPTIANMQDLGTREVGRSVVNRMQGNVRLIKDGEDIRTIRCPKTVMQQYSVRVPVRKSRVVKVPSQQTYSQMRTKAVPYSQEIKKKHWVVEEVSVPVTMQKTVMEPRAQQFSTPIKKTRYEQYEVSVPRQVSTTRAVTYEVNEPYSTYEIRTRTIPQRVAVPTYHPKCDDKNVIQPQVMGASFGGASRGGGRGGSVRGGGGGAGLSIPISRLSDGQVIRGDFNGDGIEDKLVMGTKDGKKGKK